MMFHFSTRTLPGPSRVLALFLGVVGLAGVQTTMADTVAEPVAATGLSADRFHATDDQMRGLIEILLAENPQLASAQARSASSFERVPQARSLPDPILSYRFFAQTPETRVGPQEHMIEISQGVPWSGKRKLQAERAQRTASGMTWDVEDLERQLVAEFKRVYFEAAFLQEALRVNREERELLQRFEAIALRRYSTGQGIQQSVVKVQTDISRLDDRETELRERLGIVARRISQLIGRSDSALALDSIKLTVPDLTYDPDELEQQALARHPRVHAVEQRVEADRVWGRRQALESKPNFRFGLGYTSVGGRDDPAGRTNPPPDNGQDILALTAGVNIPIYRKRIHAGVAEARESERASEELLEAVRDRLRFDVQKALLEIDSLRERGRLYAEVIIPQAGESLASAEAAYTTNRLGFLDLLDAERILFQARLAYHRLVAELWGALADLEFSTALSLPTTWQESNAGLEAKTGLSQ